MLQQKGNIIHRRAIGHGSSGRSGCALGKSGRSAYDIFVLTRDFAIPNWDATSQMQPYQFETALLAADADGVTRAARLLQSGQLVAIPTETVYGLAADARNPAAVAGIYAAKRRPSDNPLIVHVADMATAQIFAQMDGLAQRLGDAFWPGALTLVLPLRDGHGLAAGVTAGLGTVALRVPAHPVAQALMRAFGGPIAAPSANPSGRISPTTPDHVLAGLGGRIAAVLDGGACDVGVESTILGVHGGRVTLLRPGGISAEDVARVSGHWPIAAQAGMITAPGQLASHYAPRATVRLNVTAPDPSEVWIGFGPDCASAAFNLSPAGDPEEAAAALFAILHAADALARPIAVAPIPQTGLGLAINDRLQRAAAPRA
jgi:L-threonylcarbamoyladenylate synthase